MLFLLADIAFIMHYNEENIIKIRLYSTVGSCSDFIMHRSVRSERISHEQNMYHVRSDRK